MADDPNLFSDILQGVKRTNRYVSDEYNKTLGDLQRGVGHVIRMEESPTFQTGAKKFREINKYLGDEHNKTLNQIYGAGNQLIDRGKGYINQGIDAWKNK